MVSFRCTLPVFRELKPLSSRLKGGYTAYMVAALSAFVHKLGKEGAVPPLEPAPPPSAKMLRSMEHFDRFR